MASGKQGVQRRQNDFVLADDHFGDFLLKLLHPRREAIQHGNRVIRQPGFHLRLGLNRREGGVCEHKSSNGISEHQRWVNGVEGDSTTSEASASSNSRVCV